MIGTPQSPVVRIVLISVALLLLLLGGVTLLFHQPADEDGARFAVQRLVNAFENKDMAGFLDEVEFPLAVGWRDTPYEEESLRRELASVWSRLVYISIELKDVTIDLEDGGERATATVDFHWTVSSEMYPNARARSRDYNPEGAPERALLALENGPNGWKVVNVMELSRH